jgi:NAD-dependent SIR2 family protein deacetylase
MAARTSFLHDPMNFERENAFITGAGLSANAGLPLQRSFTAAFLKAQSFAKKGPSKQIVSFLCEFVTNVFGLQDAKSADGWPELEDLFTVIDLSANTGHHLGRRYQPSELRTVRRALIVRLIRMLSQHYGTAQKKRGEDWQLLESFFSSLDLNTAGFVSLNWDTVIEQQALGHNADVMFDYGCDARAAVLESAGKLIEPKQKKRGTVVPLLKLHGSTNWLYCDNCRRLYWFPPAQEVMVSDQLLHSSDWRYIDPGHKHRSRKSKCFFCKANLGTRLATFSYTKALDFPMFQKSWFSAEKLLMHAENWIFFGYSLPPANYEFKYLLKRCQLARSERPRIMVVTAGDAAQTTISRYRQFFGQDVSHEVDLKSGVKVKQLREFLSHLKTS